MNSSAFLKTSNEVRITAAQIRERLQSPTFLILWLGPYAVFLLIALLYTHGFLMVPSVCVLVSIIFTLVGGCFLVVRNRGALYLGLGTGILVSVLFGTLFGLYTYDKFAVFPKFYANSRLYTNVVPTQPAAAVSDAGKIVFTSESFVDEAKSAGFVTESGAVYCAAPVRDLNNLLRVEFWAVGQSCCDARGAFWCDSARERAAHSGITVFDNNGFFDNSNYDEYLQAKEKAEATFRLISAEAPLLVRWVTEENMDMLANWYQSQASLVLFILCLLQAFGSFGLACILYKPTSLSLMEGQH